MARATREVKLFVPHIGPETYGAAKAALDNGWLGMGSFVKCFEERLGEYLGNPKRKIVSCNTATSALGDARYNSATWTRL